MTSLMIELLEIPKARQVSISDDTLTVDLSDGRTISVPLAWYPRLLHSKQNERSNWRFIGDNEGIHWSDIDEDISVKNIILGQPSAESQKSFQRWQEERIKS
ncbi:MAG: DUF2442 domain-containing protein [Coleofasciculaceae cyanobacterium SM2_1_6]|nr:DUF2442 domain-containing protein [Coleofasciculaceae cyanobacterium SM2_1_6]